MHLNDNKCALVLAICTLVRCINTTRDESRRKVFVREQLVKLHISGAARPLRAVRLSAGNRARFNNKRRDRRVGATTATALVRAQVPPGDGERGTSAASNGGANGKAQLGVL